MPDSTYRVMVCEYNGDPLTEKYLTSGASGNPANQQMKSILINEIDADTPGTGDACRIYRTLRWWKRGIHPWMDWFW